MWNVPYEYTSEQTSILLQYYTRLARVTQN